MNENLIKLLSTQKVFPIIRSDNPVDVVKKVDALVDGGVNIVEIIVENSKIYEAIKEVKDRATICAGGIITGLQAQMAVEMGAEFISSPIFQMNLIKLSKDYQIPYIAGTSTANEAYEAWKARAFMLKIYPINALGGVQYVENLLRPMNFLNVMVQGDVKLSEVNDYIKVGAHAVGVGRDIFNGYSYSEVTQRIKDAVAELKG